MKRHTLPVLLAVAALLVTAGGWSAYHFLVPAPEKVTMNSTQAKSKAEHLLDDTLSAVQPKVTWQPDYAQAILNYRGIDSDYDGTAQVLVTRDLFTSISTPKLTILVQAVAHRWKQRGYAVTVEHTSNGIPSAEADTPDGDHLSVDLVRAGAVSFGATVGTFKGPTDEADAEWVYGKPHQLKLDAQGKTIFPPLKDDPYWSH